MPEKFAVLRKLIVFPTNNPKGQITVTLSYIFEKKILRNLQNIPEILKSQKPSQNLKNPKENPDIS